MKRLTTEEFIERAQKVHGDRYDYSKSVYTKSSEKICITCNIHGDFWQSASSHLMGAGCPECGKERVGKARLSFTREEFLNKSHDIHGDRYDYSETVVGAKEDKVKIICPIHGEFEQIARIHMEGGKCPRCRYEENGKKLSMGWDGFIERARKKHGDRYVYPETFKYKNNYDKVPITCRKHGVFWQDVAGHLAGHGCPECDRETHGNKSKDHEKLKSCFIERAKRVHGDRYDYSCIKDFQRYDIPVPVICEKHGVFMQRPSNHINGCGCPNCGRESISEKKLMGVETFISRAKEIHGEKYDYSKVNFERANEKTTIICPIHGEFVQTPTRHLQGSGCPKCANQSSRAEDEVSEFISSLGFSVDRRNRDVIKPYELDILVKEKKVGVEFDGLIWHSERFSSPTSHLKKSKMAKGAGYRLIHIFEDEWSKKKDIVKSRLKSILGVTERKLYARKCDVREIPTETSRKFLEENHLQGNAGATDRLGLYHKNELVAIMTFSKQRKSLGGKSADGVYELVRFCSKMGVSVVGGASKLLKHFIRAKRPKKIITYADKRWSNGELYFSLGFKWLHDSKPNYFYIVNKTRENRFKYRKDRLVSEGYDPSKSEHEIMLERGIYRIYDCGSMVFEWCPKKNGGT